MVELFLTAPSQHEYEAALQHAINDRIASRIAEGARQLPLLARVVVHETCTSGASVASAED